VQTARGWLVPGVADDGRVSTVVSVRPARDEHRHAVLAVDHFAAAGDSERRRELTEAIDQDRVTMAVDR